MEFEHQRHKPQSELAQKREIIIACCPMRSNVNLSRIIRMAGCCAIFKVICTGQAKIDRKIARDGADTVEIEVRRSLPPVLKKLKEQGYHLVGLEQTTNSQNMHEYEFPKKCVLVIGNERAGIDDPVLEILDSVVEIPVWGMPFSYNAATSAVMAMYEYCRQYPDG